ncbi:hypothetical protein DQ384_15440 [Sphaerisporangium album]|uniref:Uncharacterized protein n=1 Tax=Sphaerisporangium album TaxID=509200 RepID=A0A367FK97_9ACTN|nr:hypothetical protein [Sphaerisporangium album]RCG30671.1 hypothetical protein DQ384_15440 [Sphaerisporangium album]
MTGPSPLVSAALVVLVAVLIAVAVAYCARYRLPRPPVGTYTYPDMVVVFVVVVLAPLTYLHLPGPVVAGVFGLVLLSAAHLALAPVIGGGRAWAVSGVLCLATAAAAFAGAAVAVTVLTDVLLVIGVVAVTTLWAQSGMRAGHVALFAALLTVYDLIATVGTTMMTRFLTDVRGLPFAPLLALDHGASPVAIGLGDLMMLVLFPLVAGRSFGRPAGLVAALAGVTVTAVVSALFVEGVLDEGVPLLTILGPVVVAQYLFWRGTGHRELRARERGRPPAPAGGTPGRPRSARAATGPIPDPALTAALAAPPRAEPWVAVHEGRVAGTGATPGLARRAARENGCPALPAVHAGGDLTPIAP